jgi:hypothetical protein
LNYAGRFDALIAEGLDAHSLAHVHSLPHSSTPADAIVVPDAHLLFHGDFKRSGVDLILSGDEREIVLHDYFRGDKRAALASPDGAHLTGDIVNALTGSVEVSQAGGDAGAGRVIGHVTKLAGTATATRNGVSIILHQGDNVEKGDVVQSGSDSTLGITFIDGTVFGLSSNARMVLNEMVYDPNGSNNSSLLSLVAGTISFVAGETAKHGDMKIDTPVATMGIRGTAVLVEIDFTVPGQGGTPDAKFQVLVEPDGTTGSYILFDKTTLQPLAVVNQAGQQINISQGVITQSNAPLPPDVQKLIQDVFTLKFSDNSNPNPKTTTGQNDTITPQTGPVQKADNGTTATPIFVTVNGNGNANGPNNLNGPNGLVHIAGPPDARMLDAAGHVTSSFAVIERINKTADATDLDGISGNVNFVDINAGDTPTVQVEFSGFAYQNAQGTHSLNQLQLADIAKTEVAINVVPAAGNSNTGSATFTYSVPDNAFDFLAAGETLTLTYVARIDNNFQPANETKLIPFTITVTGTNDVPVITTGPQTIAFHGGTNEPGGTLPLTSNDPTHGTLTFTDVDLTDTHTVKVELKEDLPGVNIPEALSTFFAQALTVTIATDSTGTGTGTVNWTLAPIPVYDADFIPAGETLTLTYTVTVTDSQNTTSTQTITVTIAGTAPAAEVWIHTTGDSSPDGKWSTGQNWETGLAPTATDDVIIITDQLQHLTPSYPVTIDTQAVANSVKMNNFSVDYPKSAPQLIVASAVEGKPQNSLTIGGDFKLSVDAEVDNSGIITVGGQMEVAGSSKVTNYGLLTLKQGGDFTDSAAITNSGTIDVSGKTLNVLVGVTNFFQVDPDTVDAGQITVDSDATLALGDPKNSPGVTGGITGGTVTINGTLELDGTSFLKTGTLNNESGGAVNVKGAAAFDGETVDNDSTIEIFAGAVLTIDQGSSVDNTNGTITIDAASVAPALGAATLTLNGATITSGTLTISGTLDSTGSSAIHDANITNTGLIESTGGTLTIDPAALVSITNSGTLEANGGELDIASEPITNTGTLQAINHGTLKLTSTTVTNSNGGSVSIEAGSTLDLVDLVGAGISGGTLTNFGAFDSVSGVNVVTATVTNTGTIEVMSGTLDLAGGLTGAGKVIIDKGATLELAGANGQTITFAGDGATLQLDSTTLPFTGTIAGVSTVGGNFTITGPGNITSTSRDALDFTATGGTVGSPANVTLTPSGKLSGAANGIVVIQNGTGDLTVDPSGNVTGLAGNGIIVEDSSTGVGNIVVHDSGSTTGTGTGSVGLLVENSNKANDGNITITQLGGASGDSYGFDVVTQGDGNIALESDGAVSAAVQYGIRVRSFGTGSESVTTDAKSVINSGGSGIVAANRDTSIDASAKSTITVTAHGTIHSGTNLNLSDTAPAGILAGYNGIGGFGSQANTNVNGTVTVDNFANITAAAGSGIEAYNYGNGNVTVNDEAVTTVSGAQYGIAAYQLSGGTGDVTIDVAKDATITGTSIYGILAFSNGIGSIGVSTASDDTITSGSSGIVAVNEATSISRLAHSTISVIANGTIHSGASNTTNDATPAGIGAGYFPGATGNTSDDVAGNVIVQSSAAITADAGYGIHAYNDGIGNVTVTTYAASSIHATGTAIGAFANDGGNVSVTNHGTATGAIGLSAFANLAGNITIINDGHITGTTYVGISVGQDVAGSTGSTHITNTGTVLGAGNYAAIAIFEDATGTATIDNSGTIGSSVVSSSTLAIFEGGGDVTINNAGNINGNVSLANATFNNEVGGTWKLAGSSEFGLLAYTGAKSSTIDNAGTIDLSASASLTGAHGLTITDSGAIYSLSGSDSINGAAISVTSSGLFEVTGGTLTIDATSSVTNAGTLEAANGGTLIIEGTLSGIAEIVGASLIELGASDQGAYANSTITFTDDSAGTLKLDHAETFKGTISGLDDNTLDLGDITSGVNTTVTFDSQTGILTVVNNADSSDVAQIKLAGDYSGSSWIAADDLHGGTTVTEVPGAITAGLDQHGNATEGVAVTASATDGGQAEPNASYHWQIYDTTTAMWGEGSGTGGNTANYIPGEQDEGHLLQVSISFVDADGGTETNTISAGTVAPVADVPVVAASASEIKEGGSSNLAITLSNATDLFENGGDSVTVTVTLSDGAVLHGDGVHDNGDVRFTLTATSVANFSGLTITPASEFEGAVTVDVSAVAHDGAAVSAAGTTTTTLTVDPVADVPAVTATASEIKEGGTSDLTINFSNATDLFENGGDNVTVTVTLSDGAVLHCDGVHDNGDGSFTLTATSVADLSGLTITPASEFEGAVTVDVSAVAHDGAAFSTAGTTTTTLTVDPVADVPVVAATASEINEGGSSNLAITLSNATDLFVSNDDSVVVTVTLSDGAVLSSTGAGVNDNGHGTFTLTAHSVSDLSHLTITPASDFNGAVTVNVSAVAHDGTAVSTAGTAIATLTVDEVDDATVSLTGLNSDNNAVEHQQIIATVIDADAPSSGIVYTWTVGDHTVQADTPAGNTYTPTDADEGKAISVAVSFTDTHKNAESITASAGTVQESSIPDDDAQVTFRQTHLPPVIDTTHVSLTQNMDGSTTISDLSVLDTDSSAASKPFTVSATALSGAAVSPPHDSGSLSSINADLNGGFTYHPGSPAPQTDTVTLTVADAFGDSGTVNFVFNEGGQGPNVTLHSTSGTDIIFATAYSDTFVFAPSKIVNQDTVIGFDPAHDHIDVSAFPGINNLNKWLENSNNVVQQGPDTLLTLDNHDTVLLKNVQANLLAGDFIVSPHHGGGSSTG